MSQGFTRRGSILLIWLALLAASWPPLLAQNSPSVAQGTNTLTEAVQVLNLTPEQAEKKIPVQLRGVVTFFDPAQQLCFIQDLTAGIYIYNVSGALSLKLGDSIDVTGLSGAGLFSPIVHAVATKLVGTGTLPTAKPVSIEQLASGKEDSQWVQVEGIVHRATEEWSYLILDLSAGPSRLTIRMLEHPAGLANKYIDARVRVQGVVGTAYNKKRQLTGFHLYVPGAAQVTILEPPPADPFDAPIRQSRSLMAYSRKGISEHRIRLQGVVTLQQPGRALYIKDDSGAIQIGTTDKAIVEPGDVVDVIGFPAPGGYTPILEDAIFRKIGKKAAPKPAVITSMEALSGEFDKELVQMEAVLITQDEALPGQRTLVLQSGKAVFPAVCHATNDWFSSESLLNGSRLLVSGLCSVDLNERTAPASFSLLLRSATDVKVLQRPVRAKVSPLVLNLSLSSALVLLGLGWVVQLRKRTREVTARKQSEAALRESEQHLRNSMEERERIGRDLHDGIIQSIYAVGLNLADCRTVLKEKPHEVDVQLARILDDLNAVIREVRTFILGLESNALKGQEFKAALKSLVLTLGDAHASRFCLHIDPAAAESLTSKQATQLLHIAREAMTNSVRHASADQTTLSLRVDQGGLHFEIEDNGIGFDTGSVASQGFGLRNMASRAQDIGARFALTSHKGKGTRIVLDIPDKSLHQSE